MKIFRRSRYAIAAISISLSITSCSSTAEYKAFSQAGMNYSDSLNELIKCSGTVGLDASSYQVFQNDAIVNFSLKGYLERKKADERRLELLNQSRDQISLFKRYFVLIGELASVGDTVPLAVGTEITNIANGLTDIKTKVLRNSDFPTSEFNIGLGKLATLIISSEIRGAIRKELEIRKSTLQESLLIHRILVKKLIDEDISDLSIIKNFIEDRDVVQPLLKTDSQTSWFEARKNVIKIQKLIWDLNTQSKISDEFAKVFEEMVTDRANLPRANYLSQQAMNNKMVFGALCDYFSYKQAKETRQQIFSSNFLLNTKENHKNLIDNLLIKN
jgi:hypothetical protein